MKNKEIDRRTFIKRTGAAAVALSTIGFPAVVRSQTKMSEVEIALVSPFTGPSGSEGQILLRGWNIAVEEINVAGGINSLGGARIKTAIHDTQTNPRVGMGEVEKVAQNKKIPLVVGCYNSGVTFPASQISEQYGLPHLIDVSSQTAIMRRGFKYVFRMNVDAARQGQSYVDFSEGMGKRTGYMAKRVAIISVDDNFGRDNVNQLKMALEKTNQQLVEEIYVPVKLTNVDVEVAKLKAAKPDVIYFMSYVADAVMLTKALYAQKVDTIANIAAASGFTDPQYLELVGNLGNYFFLNALFDDDHNRPMEVEFDNKMMKLHGHHVNFSSAILYSCAYLVKDVLERAGSIDRDKVRDAFASTNITSGRATMIPCEFIRFDERGENIGAICLKSQCLNKRWHTVWPFDRKRKHEPVWPVPKWEERKL